MQAGEAYMGELYEYFDSAFLKPVSYTHLDVYKRQSFDNMKSMVATVLANKSNNPNLVYQEIGRAHV